MGRFFKRREIIHLPSVPQSSWTQGLLRLSMIFHLNRKSSLSSSFHGSRQSVVHKEEEYSEEPNCNEDIVHCYCYVLLVLLYLHNQSHCVQNQHRNEDQPGDYCMVDPVVEEIYAQKGWVIRSVPARPYSTSLLPWSYMRCILTLFLNKWAIPTKR